MALLLLDLNTVKFRNIYKMHVSKNLLFPKYLMYKVNFYKI